MNTEILGVVAQNTGHYAYPEQTNKAWKWMMDLLKVNNKKKED